MKVRLARTLGIWLLTGSVLCSPVRCLVTASATNEHVTVRIEFASWECGSSHDRTIHLGGESLPEIAVCAWVSILKNAISGRRSFPLTGPR